MKYKYKAVDNKNRVLVEKINLDTEKDVLSYLKNKDYKIIWIKKDLDLRKNMHFSKMKISDIQFFLYRLYILTSSNINLPKAMELLIAEEKNSKNKKIYKAVLEEIKTGNTLYNSMKHTEAFPDIVINMIKIGEESSRLSEVFRNLAMYYREEINFNKKVKSAMYYPILLIFVTIIIVNFLTITILPQFVDIFYENKDKIPISTKILMGISKFMNDNYIIMLGSLTLILAGMYLFIKSSKGKIFRDRMLVKVEFYRNILLKRFISEMCLLLNSGMTLFKSIDIVSRSIDNAVFSKELSAVTDELNSGKNLSNSLKDSEVFTDLFVSLIKVSEETAKADEIFNSLEELYSFEIKIKEEKFIKLLEPSIIIILSVIVGFVVMAVAVPMFDIVNGI